MKESVKKRFGTFSGVFLPSTLAILGAVMYYIAPQIVGGVGLLKAIFIILIAHSVTIATAFSISAIATNINVKGGGLYYLISRSLGSEFGGSLGIQLYLAQTIAASFYSMAFGRGVFSLLASFGIVFPEFYLGLFSLALFGLIVFIGARFVVKLQMMILAAVALSLVSVFLAPNINPVNINLLGPTTIPFWVAFAMFFPAVTGIDAGVGMSGELKNPRKSIVKGTFLAIFITMGVYIALAFKYSMAAAGSDLVSNPHIVQSIAAVPWLVMAGILMATSSSALSSLMTSPRCLTAMVKDEILPKWLGFLGRSSEKNSEPRIAILFSLIIGLGVITLGSLEFVSQIVSMFFLSVYGWINGAAFFEKVSQNPSYRPLFNAPAAISFYGMFSAYAIMYLFNPAIMMVVIIIQAIIFVVLFKTKKSMKLESVWDGVFFQLLKGLMKRISASEKSKKNWRPTVLAFCANDLNKTSIANVLHWIGSQSSITKLYFLKKGSIKENMKDMKKAEKSLVSYVNDNKLDIFPRILMVDDFEETISSLVQAESIGNLPLNTVMVDYEPEIRIDKLITDMANLKKNIIILRNQSGFSNFKRVDVWWSSEKNGNLMILLAYLITHSKKWLESETIIRVFKVTEPGFDSKEEKKKLKSMIADSRIENIDIHVLKGKGRKMSSVINSRSENSDLVILGMPNYSNRKSDQEIIDSINEYTSKLKVSLVVLANDKIDFRIN